jgi:YD repeat-containing protein
VDLFTLLNRTVYADGTAGIPAGLVTDSYSLDQEYPATSQAEVQTHLDYQSTSVLPAIAPFRSTTNYIDGVYDPADPAEDVASTVTYDRWARKLVSTDPDGVATTTAYATNQTDVASTTDGVGNQTTFGYDLVGNKTSVTTPLDETTSTDYDLQSHPTLVTGPTGIKSKSVYSHGLLTTSFANWIDGSPSGPSGVDDVQTSYTYG